jgi:hypothetical protein
VSSSICRLNLPSKDLLLDDLIRPLKERRWTGGARPKAARVGLARCRIRTEGRIIGALAWTRAVIVSAGMAACLAACTTGAPIPPTYTQDELKATCERNGFRWYRDDLTGGFCERR